MGNVYAVAFELWIGNLQTFLETKGLAVKEISGGLYSVDPIAVSFSMQSLNWEGGSPFRTEIILLSVKLCLALNAEL